MSIGASDILQKFLIIATDFKKEDRLTIRSYPQQEENKKLSNKSERKANGIPVRTPEVDCNQM